MRPCLLQQAGYISALFLAMTHEGALLLAADQPPLLRCFCVSTENVSNLT